MGANEINFRPVAADKPYKWIKKDIDMADPYTEYDKIWRLSIEYNGGGDFVQNMIYALTFSNFIANEWGSQTVWRNDGGKVIHRATDRMHETQFHNSVWWFYGPHHPRTKQSADIINKRHESLAKKYPGSFSHSMDFTYVLAFTAIAVDRLRRKLQLSGFNEKQKIAAHQFWKKMSQLFLVETPGRPLSEWRPIDETTFPKDWDAMVAYCEDVENNHMEQTPKGHLIAEALFDQFAFRYFPPLLRPFGRSIPITLSLPQTLKAHHIKPTNPILARIIIFVLGTFMWIMETFAPDPKISTQEIFLQRDRTEKKIFQAERRRLDKEFPSVFSKNHTEVPTLCPFRADQLQT